MNILSDIGIPSSFDLYNHTIQVVVIDDDIAVNQFGHFDTKTNTITLFVAGVSPSVIVHTFYHELAHAVFHFAGRSELFEDETLVDVVGGLIAQFIETSDVSSDDTDSSEDS